MNTQKGFSLILVLVAILITSVLIGGAYYFGKSQSTKSKAVPFPNPVIASQAPQPTFIPTDITANWKTYINSKYKYSMKVPPSWSLIELSSEYVDVYDQPNITEAQLHDGSWLTVSINDNWSGILLDAPIDTSRSIGEVVIEKKVADIQISNYKGAKIIHTVFSPTEMRPRIFVILNVSGKFIRLDLSALSQEQLEKDSIIFDQFLSTFKFN